MLRSNLHKATRPTQDSFVHLVEGEQGCRTQSYRWMLLTGGFLTCKSTESPFPPEWNVCSIGPELGLHEYVLIKGLFQGAERLATQESSSVAILSTSDAVFLQRRLKGCFVARRETVSDSSSFNLI